MDKTAFVCPFGVPLYAFPFLNRCSNFSEINRPLPKWSKSFSNKSREVSPHVSEVNIITRFGIEVDPAKMSIIMDIPLPKNVKQLQSFLQTCNCYRHFIPNFAGVSKPLRPKAYSQRFETLAIGLFGPLQETPDGKKWIFINGDTATKWAELFALRDATAQECAITLLKEVILKYGLQRRLISDNGTRFISAVIQQICNLLDLYQIPTPVYCPQENPVERKNGDLKPRMAILVGNDPHTT
ncbi:Gag-Pol polyprotein like [Argiope bruennichi]|uniref:Gag-Pol polyprotein like n=1 Tax=Argiope bruennichi TaxID=94029 RepID=A0A8T0FKA8_ARGBR|nr:Gag-Pol polyprotein like [Argiope bruennichi]